MTYADQARAVLRRERLELSVDVAGQVEPADDAGDPRAVDRQQARGLGRTVARLHHHRSVDAAAVSHVLEVGEQEVAMDRPHRARVDPRLRVECEVPQVDVCVDHGPGAERHRGGSVSRLLPAFAGRTCGPAGDRAAVGCSIREITSSSTVMPRPGRSPRTIWPSSTDMSTDNPVGGLRSCSSVAMWFGTAVAAWARPIGVVPIGLTGRS